MSKKKQIFQYTFGKTAIAPPTKKKPVKSPLRCNKVNSRLLGSIAVATENRKMGAVSVYIGINPKSQKRLWI
jgi:hypothetical protein